MVCPALEKYIGEQLHLESPAVTERRKTAEERYRAIAKKRLRPSGLGQQMEQGRRRQQRAAPQCHLRVPPPEPATIPSLQPTACRTVAGTVSAGAPGMLLEVVPLTSYAAGAPFRPFVIRQCFKPLFAKIWNVPAWMRANLQKLNSLGTPCHSQVRARKKAATLRSEFGLLRPFSDPALVRRAAPPSEFLHEACWAGFVALDKYAEATVRISW